MHTGAGCRPHKENGHRQGRWPFQLSSRGRTGLGVSSRGRLDFRGVRPRGRPDFFSPALLGSNMPFREGGLERPNLSAMGPEYGNNVIF